MAKQLIINQTLNECRAALIENGEILDFLMERSYNQRTENNHVDFPFVGDIYKGKVVRVLPGMQSAFVDIGYEKAAFLYVGDIREDLDSDSYPIPDLDREEPLEETVFDEEGIPQKNENKTPIQAKIFVLQKCFAGNKNIRYVFFVLFYILKRQNHMCN